MERQFYQHDNEQQQQPQRQIQQIQQDQFLEYDIKQSGKKFLQQKQPQNRVERVYINQNGYKKLEEKIYSGHNHKVSFCLRQSEKYLIILQQIPVEHKKQPNRFYQSHLYTPPIQLKIFDKTSKDREGMNRKTVNLDISYEPQTSSTSYSRLYNRVIFNRFNMEIDRKQENVFILVRNYIYRYNIKNCIQFQESDETTKLKADDNLFLRDCTNITISKDCSIIAVIDDMSNLKIFEVDKLFQLQRDFYKSLQDQYYKKKQYDQTQQQYQQDNEEQEAYEYQDEEQKQDSEEEQYYMFEVNKNYKQSIRIPISSTRNNSSGNVLKFSNSSKYICVHNVQQHIYVLDQRTDKYKYFVTIPLKDIYQIFFSNDDNLISVLQQQQDQINQIKYNYQVYKINYNQNYTKIKVQNGQNQEISTEGYLVELFSKKNCAFLGFNSTQKYIYDCKLEIDQIQQIQVNACRIDKPYACFTKDLQLRGYVHQIQIECTADDVIVFGVNSVENFVNYPLGTGGQEDQKITYGVFQFTDLFN